MKSRLRLVFYDKKTVFAAGAVAAAFAVIFVLRATKSIEIIGDGRSQTANVLAASRLSGVVCENAGKRPVAAMLALDPETRPLSGIGQADMVFEMPVTPTGITRIMAVFECNLPEEIGSIRSARLDFIPLVQGLDAIYTHWGGERNALSVLDNGIVDNIDALRYENIYYYRKKDRPRPHNGFTNAELINKAINKLNYRTETGAESYKHSTNELSRGFTNPPEVYSGNYKVDWNYNSENNSYLRTRAGRPEIDRNTGRQVEAKNIVIMETSWSPINLDYIRVRTVGSGNVIIYNNGKTIKGTWEKTSPENRLVFFDNSGEEIRFAPGAIWIEIMYANSVLRIRTHE